MRKLVKNRMFELKIHVDKELEFKTMFEKNFELAYADDGLNIKVLSNYKSTIPEKYRNLIYDRVEGSYINNISKGFKFFSSDIEDKTDDYLFEYLKDKCERCLDDFQNIDNEISQYLSSQLFFFCYIVTAKRSFLFYERKIQVCSNDSE